jgi:drug/metabolite transporter (DMT)-like permease
MRQPLWTIIVGALIFKVSTNRMQWMGMAVAAVGLVVLLDINPHSIVSVDFVGFICMLAATLCYAM